MTTAVTKYLGQSTINQNQINFILQTENLKSAKEEMEVAEKAKKMLDEGKNVRDGEWNGKEIEWLNTQLFFTAKPMIYLVNIGAKEYVTKKNKYLPKIAEWIKAHGGGPMLPYSADFEA